MKLLVLGADSNLGVALIGLLQSEGVEYLALATSELNLLKRTEVVKACVSCKPSQIVNLASYSDLEMAESDPEAAKECDILNSSGVSTLAEVCKQLNLPLVHHSSAYVFDGKKIHPYVETDTTNPSSHYGQSRWSGERAIRDVLPNHVIVRTDWLFGTPNHDFFRQYIATCKQNSGKLEVMNHRFCPTPTSDVARVLLAITRQVDCAAEVWGTYHYCASQPLSLDIFVSNFLQIAAQFDTQLATVLPALQITKYPVRKPFIASTVLSSQRVFETFGIKQRSRVAELTVLIEDIYGIEHAQPIPAKPNADTEVLSATTKGRSSATKRKVKSKVKGKLRSKISKPADSGSHAKTTARRKDTPLS